MILSKRHFLILIILVAAVSALVGGAAGGLLTAGWMNRLSEGTPIQEELLVEEISASQDPSDVILVDDTNIETSITAVVEQVGPAVVTVVGSVERDSGRAGEPPTADVSGSGVFISEDGYLITNEHVVDGARDFRVILQDGQVQEATLIASDVFSDLAVLKTEQPPPAVAPLGNSDLLDPGETVIASGSPLGMFMNSVTTGVVSAVGRSIDTGRGYRIEDLIQTDAAINQGNSGGPLVNLAGEVIGINNLVVRGNPGGAVAEGLGFAIPSNTVEAVADQIIQTGDFLRPYLGVQYQPITPAISRRYDLPVEWGAYVFRVNQDSPAELAGVQENDIITRIGALDLDQENSFINALYQYHPGDSLEIGLIREGEGITIELTAGGL